MSRELPVVNLTRGDIMSRYIERLTLSHSDVSRDVYNMDADRCSPTLSTTPSYDDMPDGQEQEVSTSTHKAKRLKNKTCSVCGDKALGHNFNAVTCESCKAFFRRNAFKNFKGRCEGKCEITIETRSYCKRCRLQKCLTVGMKKDLILNDEQRQQRRMKIEENRMRRSCPTMTKEQYNIITQSPFMTSPTQLTSPVQLSSPQMQMTSSSIDFSPAQTDTMVPMSSGVSTDVYAQQVKSPPQSDTDEETVSPTEPQLPEEYQRLIDELQSAYHNAFVNKPNLTEPSSAAGFVNLAEASSRRIVKMAKHLEFFKALEQKDQISLLKGAVVEILIMRSSKFFDPATNTWNVPVASANPRMKLGSDLIQQHSEELFGQYAAFATSLQLLTKGDHCVMLILIAMSIFSPDRSNLGCRDMVSKIQEKYAACLSGYVKQRFSNSRTLFPRLLQKLADIRELDETHCQMLQIVDTKNLEPLLVEIFDLSS